MLFVGRDGTDIDVTVPERSVKLIQEIEPRAFTRDMTDGDPYVNTVHLAYWQQRFFAVAVDLAVPGDKEPALRVHPAGREPGGFDAPVGPLADFGDRFALELRKAAVQRLGGLAESHAYDGRQGVRPAVFRFCHAQPA